MKKNKSILILLISLAFVFSCAVDDDPVILPADDIFEVVSLDQSGENFVPASAGDNITVNVILSAAMSNNTLVNYTLNGAEESLTIPAGSTSAALVFPNVVGSTNTITLTGGLNLDQAVNLGTNTTATFISVPNPLDDALTLVLSLEDSNFGGTTFFTIGVFDGEGAWVTDAALTTNFVLELPFFAPGLPNSPDLPGFLGIDGAYYALDIFTIGGGGLAAPGYTIYII